MAQTMTIQVRGRGTVTLPAALREKYRLDDGDPLTVVDLDGVVLLSLRLLVVPRLAAEMNEGTRLPLGVRFAPRILDSVRFANVDEPPVGGVNTIVP